MHRISVYLVLLLLGGSFEPLHAQADWGVKRDPFDKTIVARSKKQLRLNPMDSSAFNRLTKLYKNYRSLNKLVGEYESELKLHGGQVYPRVVLARLEEKRGQRIKAITYLQHALHQEPKNRRLWEYLGHLHRDENNLNDAMNALEEALNHSPVKEQTRLLWELVSLSTTRDDLEGVKKYLNKLSMREPKNANIPERLGDALTQKEKHREAIAAYQQALNRVVRNKELKASLISRMAGNEASVGNDDKALALYDQAIAVVGRTHFLARDMVFHVVDIHRKKRSLAKLIVRLEGEWLTKQRGHFEWDTLARLYDETGQQKKSYKAYEQALKKSPTDLDTHRRYIALLESAGKDDQALKQYEKVIRLAPGEPQLKMTLAKKYYDRGEEKKALAMTKSLERSYPRHAGVQSLLADLYMGWNQQKLALKCFERLTRIEPKESRHIVALGQQHQALGDGKRADAVWQRLIKEKNAANYAALGNVYGDHDRLFDAIKMFDAAIALEPLEPQWRRLRAQTLERSKQPRQAMADWEVVLGLLPIDTSQRVARDTARQRMIALMSKAEPGRLKDRVKEWTRKFEEPKVDIESGLFLLEVAIQKNDSNNAQTLLERLVKLEPKNTLLSMRLVHTYRKNRDYDKALNLLESLIAKDPSQERQYLSVMSKIKVALHQDDEAVAYATRALEKSPKDPQAYRELGERYQSMLHYDKALQAYEKALELAPNDVDVSFLLATMYLQQNRSTEAAHVYRSLLAHLRKPDWIEQTLERALKLDDANGTLGDLERVLLPLAATSRHKSIYSGALVKLYGRYIPWLTQRAGQGEHDARLELDTISSRSLKPLLSALTNKSDLSQRDIAVDALGDLGNVDAAIPLIDFALRKELKTSKPAAFAQATRLQRRFQALIAAGRLAHPPALDRFLKLLKRSEIDMRHAAIFGLGMIHDKRAIRPLMSHLNDKHESIRVLAILALAHQKSSLAISALEGVLGDTSEDEAIRAIAAYALGFMGGQSSERALIDALGPGDGIRQSNAAWALGRIKTTQGQAALVRFYFTKEGKTRDAFAHAITHVGMDSFSFLDLHAILSQGRLVSATDIVSRLGATENKELLGAAALLNTNIKNAVITGLNDSFSGRVGPLRKTLSELDGRNDHLGLGPITLGALSSEQKAELRLIASGLVPHWIALARHHDSYVRIHSLSLLSKFADRKAEQTMRAALNDSNGRVRSAAWISTARFNRRHPGSSNGFDKVRLLSRSRTWQERRAVIPALVESGQEDDFKRLVVMAKKDPIALVRSEAIGGLMGTVNHTDYRDIFVQAADYRVELAISVRLQALRALVHLKGDQGARRALQKASKDPAREVRELAQTLRL